MTWSLVALTVGLGLMINELCDVSPWLARRLIRWSARLRYGHSPARLTVRVEELEALLDNVPGKLIKIVCAVGFVSRALVFHIRFTAREILGRVPLEKHAAVERLLGEMTDRHQVSMGLHDHVIQRVFATGIGIQSTLRQVEDDAVRQRLERAVEELDTTIREVRTTIYQQQVTANSGRSVGRHNYRA